RKMGQGGEVRGHQARVIRSARVPIFHNLSIQDFREADVAYGSQADVQPRPAPGPLYLSKRTSRSTAIMSALDHERKSVSLTPKLNTKSTTGSSRRSTTDW